jgi:hypothetical protein
MTETKWLSESELRSHKWFVQRPRVLDEIIKYCLQNIIFLFFYLFIIYLFILYLFFIYSLFILYLFFIYLLFIYYLFIIYLFIYLFICLFILYLFIYSLFMMGQRGLRSHKWFTHSRILDGIMKLLYYYIDIFCCGEGRESELKRCWMKFNNFNFLYVSYIIFFYVIA